MGEGQFPTLEALGFGSKREQGIAQNSFHYVHRAKRGVVAATFFPSPKSPFSHPSNPNGKKKKREKLLQQISLWAWRRRAMTRREKKLETQKFPPPNSSVWSIRRRARGKRKKNHLWDSFSSGYTPNFFLSLLVADDISSSPISDRKKKRKISLFFSFGIL